MSHLVGIDLGTTRVKAVVYTVDGSVVASADAPTPWHRHPRSGTEMDVDDLTVVIGRVVADATAGIDGVGGIGVTGMGEAGVLAAADGRALAPIRAWHNERADLDAIAAGPGADAFRRATGLELTGVASIGKILQMRADYPASAAATRFYSLPEWAVRLLGGEPGSEWSLASRTGMLDCLTTTSWPGAVELLGADLLGAPQRAGTHCGTVATSTPCPGIAHLAGAVLTVGGHDHQTAALAAGATGQETLFNSLGTAEAIIRMTSAPLSRADVADLVGAGFGVGPTVVPGYRCVIGGLHTGMELEQLASSLGAVDRAARRALADDPRWRAGVERIIASAEPMLEAMERRLGRHERVLAAGGWLHDRTVHDAKQRQLGGLVSAFVDEGGAVGAAYLAGFAAGLLPSPESITGPPWPRTLQPEGDLAR